MKIIIMIVIVVITFSCYSGKKTKNIELPRHISIDNAEYWSKVSPIMFIDTLRKYKNTVFSIDSMPTNDWYKIDYIKVLNNFIADSTICGGVISPYISERPIYRKTNISKQSMYIIESIKQKKFPHSLSSL